VIWASIWSGPVSGSTSKGRARRNKGAFTLTVWRLFVLLRSPFFEFALMLVRFNHVARIIINADHCNM
jgi:hypothetical protein